MTASTERSSDFFLHLLTSFDFRSLSMQSNLLNFGLPAVLLSSGYLRSTFLTVLPTDILIRRPAHSNMLRPYRRHLQRRAGRFASSSEDVGYFGKATGPDRYQPKILTKCILHRQDRRVSLIQLHQLSQGWWLITNIR